MASGDSYIISGILREDPVILEMIYEDYFPLLNKFVRKQGGDPEDAKDIFQDALVAIFMKARENPDFLSVKFSTYLMRICRYIWYGLYNERQRYRDVEDISRIADEKPGIVDILFEMERHKLVWKHFNNLNPRCKKLIKLSLDGTPIFLIKEIMGFSSIQYTKNRKTECKNKLVKRIRNCPYFSELKNEHIRETSEVPRW